MRPGGHVGRSPCKESCFLISMLSESGEVCLWTPAAHLAPMRHGVDVLVCPDSAHHDCTNEIEASAPIEGHCGLLFRAQKNVSKEGLFDILRDRAFPDPNDDTVRTLKEEPSEPWDT